MLFFLGCGDKWPKLRQTRRAPSGFVASEGGLIGISGIFGCGNGLLGIGSVQFSEEINLHDAEFALHLVAISTLVEVEFASVGGSQFDNLSEGFLVGG